MRSRPPLLALLLLMLTITPPAWSHEPMAIDCVAPVRPADDQNEALWHQFLAEIDAFQTCITEAADRHQAWAEEHQRAAYAAVEAWNDFVRTSLNAPKDFPWPPEER